MSLASAQGIRSQESGVTRRPEGFANFYFSNVPARSTTRGEVAATGKPK